MTSVMGFFGANYRVWKDKLSFYWNLDRDTAVSNANVVRDRGPSTYYDDVYNFITEPTKIEENLYLGNSYNAANYQQLTDLGIDTIINVTQEIGNYFEDDFYYIRIPVLDNNLNSLQTEYEQIYKYITEHPDEKIMVHCFAGRSRSASIILYYLVKSRNIKVDDALEILINLRGFVNINTTFLNEIRGLFEEHTV